MKSIVVLIAACTLALSVAAKLPVPAPSDEAKAKAAEAAAKAAHDGKVSAYQLCKAQDRAAAQYRNSGKAAKSAKPANTEPCVNPGSMKASAPTSAMKKTTKKS